MPWTWYSVTAAIEGRPPEVFQRIVRDLQRELRTQEYIRESAVAWDDAKQWIVVTAQLEGTDDADAFRALYEFLSDCISAYVVRWESSRTVPLYVATLGPDG